MKSVALFPMTREQCAMVRYSSLMHEYTPSYFFAPKFWCLNGRDINCLDGGDVVGETLSDYNKDALHDVNVIFIDYDDRLKNLSLYQTVITDATAIGTRVVLSHKMQLMLHEIALPATELEVELPDTLYEINCPILTVLTTGVRTDQFAVELALRKFFIDDGYKVAQIGSHSASQFFGFLSTPEFLYNCKDVHQNTLRFNRYVKELTDAQQPDVLILGVPEAIMKYNDKVLNNLGILPLTICSAIKSDLGILCMHCGTYNQQLFDEMLNFCRYHLSSAISVLNISNVSITEDSSNEKIMKYADFDSSFVLQGIKNMDCKSPYLFNVLSQISADAAYDHIKAELTNNARYMK